MREVHAVEVPTGRAVLPRLLPALQAALDGGPAVLPLPPSTSPEHRAVLDAMRPAEPLERDPRGPVALLLPTSGSTGTPKGVLLSAAAVRASADATHAHLDGPGSWLLALPPTRVAGMMVLARSVLAGTEPSVVDLGHGFDPDDVAVAGLRVLRGPGPAYTSLVARQLRQVLEAGGAALQTLAAFDAVLVGGSAADPTLLERAREQGVAVVTTYGMTETSGGCVYDGVPLAGVTVRTGAQGTVEIGGPTLASGYRLDPGRTAEVFVDGWFRTADAGRVHPAGAGSSGTRVEVLGRVDDVAVSGGVNVPLQAVDLALAGHPGLADAVAVAVPDPEWGERVVAVVVARDPADPPGTADVRAHLRDRHPAAFVPRDVVLVDALPLGPGGKVDRAAARELLAGGGTSDRTTS